MLNLNIRVRLPDGREGILLGQVFRSSLQDPEEMDVLTDDYVRITCRHNQVKVIRRRGDTVPLEAEPGGNKTKVYEVERDNTKRLREAIWHDHYQNFGCFGGMYADTWKSGDIKPLPKDEDIRQLPAQFGQQIPLPLEL